MTTLDDSADCREAQATRSAALENSVTVATTGMSLPG